MPRKKHVAIHVVSGCIRLKSRNGIHTANDEESRKGRGAFDWHLGLRCGVAVLSDSTLFSRGTTEVLLCTRLQGLGDQVNTCGQRYDG